MTLTIKNAFFLCIVGFGFSFIDSVNAAECSVNFVSAEYSKDENSILFWSNVKGELTSKQTPYKTDSHLSNILSSVDIAGRPLIVWLESTDRDNRLMSISQDSNDQWLTAVVVLRSKNEISSLSLINAPDGSSFLAFASDESGNDDVFVAQFRDGKWSDIKAHNPKNKVPDILPILSVERDGSLGLSWRTFVSPNVGYQDKFENLTDPLSALEMERLLSKQCAYDRPSVEQPESNEPLFINYYQDIFDSVDRILF